MKYYTTLRTNYSLKVNTDVIKIERAADTSLPRFFPFAELNLNLDHTTFLWFEHTKAASITSANTYFVFAHASNYMLGRLPLPTQNKVPFLQQLLSICLTSIKDKTVLSNISNLHLNSFLELLLKESMRDEAIELLSNFLNITALNNAILPHESKFYKALMTLLQLGNDAKTTRSHEKKEQFKTALNRVSDEILALKFTTITKDRLLSIISEKHVSEEVSSLVSFDAQFDEPSVNTKKKKKRHKKKTTDETGEVCAIISTQRASTEDASMDSYPVVNDIADVVNLEMASPPIEQELEQESLIATSSVITPTTSIDNTTLSPSSTSEAQLEHPLEPLLLDEPKNELYTVNLVDIPRAPVLSEEKKTSALVYSPTTNLFAPLNTQAEAPKNTLVLSKYIKEIELPPSLIAFAQELNKASQYFSVAIVGKNLYKLFLEKKPSPKFLPYELLIIFSHLHHPNPNPKGYFKNLFQSFDMVSSRNNSHELQTQLSLNLISGQINIPIEINLIEQTGTRTHEEILADFAFNKTFNTESLCLPLWSYINHAYALKGSRATLSNLSGHQISFTQQEPPPLEQKLNAIFLLAHLELQYPYPQLIRDKMLHDLRVDDLDQSLALLCHPDNHADYLQLLSTQAHLFSSCDVSQVVLKMNSLFVIKSLIDVEPYHIEQTISVLAPSVQGGRYDDYMQMKNAWVYIYHLYCTFHKVSFQQNPAYFTTSPIRQFLYKSLKEADHCYLEVIEAAAGLRESHVLIFDNAFFAMIKHVVSYHRMCLDNQKVVLYQQIQQQQALILEQQQMIEQVQYLQQCQLQMNSQAQESREFAPAPYAQATPVQPLGIQGNGYLFWQNEPEPERATGSVTLYKDQTNRF